MSTENAHKLNPNVSQTFLEVDSDNDMEQLYQSLRMGEQTIVFCKSSARADKVIDFLLSKEIHCLPFYEDSKLNTQLRNASLSLFLSGKLQVLVSTSFLARGIDLPNCEHVVQFDYAKTAVD